MGTPIRVAVMATFPLLHAGLVRVLHEDPALSVAPEMFAPEELAGPASRRELDVVILHTPNGVSPGTWPLIASLCRTVKVMMLLKDYHPPTVARALELGVTGILTEEGSGGETIFKAIHEVAAGSIWCESSPVVETGPPPPRPSEREGAVMELIRRGLSNRDIAERLCISERTVKSHVNRLLQKFQLKNRVQLALYTKEHSLDRQG